MPNRDQPKSGDTPSMAELPGHLLRRCHQISVALFHDECADFDITPLQFAVLKTLIENGSQDQATIGGTAALDRTTVAVVIQKLMERQLVRRVQSTKDKRSKIVSATERGKRLLSDVAQSVMIAQERTMSPLSHTESAEFIRLLRKMADANNAHSRAPMKMRKSG